MKELTLNIVRRTIGVALLLVLGYGVYASYQLYTPLEIGETTFEIKPGSSSTKIAEQLEDEGHIRSAVVFLMYLKLKGEITELKAGEHILAGKLSAVDIANLLTHKAAKKELQVTMIEGWTAKEFASYLEEQGVMTADSFIEAITSYDPSRHEILKDKPDNQGLEGYLFPDTYRMFPDTSADELIDKMISNLEQKYTSEMLTETERINMDIHEILTLASIIEKEVAIEDQRKMVADIFYKRLNDGIRIQSDATVNYVTGESDLQPSFADTEIQSPYNTYRSDGLPPGPIASPSLSAINAAIYPTKNQYYYFLTTPEGEIKYATTFDGHLENKRRYLD